MVLYSGNRTRQNLNRTGADQGELVTCEKCDGSGEFVRGRFRGKCFACDGQGYVEAVSGKAVGRTKSGTWPIRNTKSLFDAMDIARRKIQRPVITLWDYKFSLSKKYTTEDSICLYVEARAEKGDDPYFYLGRLYEDRLMATFIESKDYEKLADFLRTTDIEAAAIEYGRATGTCSCCGRTLTNRLSIELGIGPICRGNFGWIGVHERQLTAEEVSEALKEMGDESNEQAKQAEDAPSAEAGGREGAEGNELASDSATSEDRADSATGAAASNVGRVDGNGSRPVGLFALYGVKVR